ncbi:MAG TPA: CaiB/BaiF CoA-transferase family protein [Methylomirabilota bacterium]|nr:CaiB/BaiF CoA-transferase family protein [Methylomirabilota bacterium]
MTDPSARLLDGLTVLDFTRVLAGPYCTRLMADLGARVLKIERPGEGDDTRRGYIQLEEGRLDQASYFVRINVGKESVGIDLSHSRGREVVLDLARKADVAIENFLPGVAAKLGVDHAGLARVKPDIVYCSISGFGQTGPMRDTPAFHHIINAVSGIMYLERQDQPVPPVSYLQAADVLAGTHAFGAILAALFRHGRTGRGAHVDVSMLEAMIAAEDITYGAIINGGEVYPGPRAGMVVHHLEGGDFVMQTVGAPQLWNRLLVAMKRPELNEDSRFSTPLGRRQNWNALLPIILEWLDGFGTRERALAGLREARLPASPVLSPTEVVALPHLEARTAFPEVPHPGRGKVRVTAVPFHVDGRPSPPQAGAPYRLGEHTRHVLAGLLGYSAARIAELARASVIAVP